MGQREPMENPRESSLESGRGVGYHNPAAVISVHLPEAVHL